MFPNAKVNMVEAFAKVFFDDPAMLVAFQEYTIESADPKVAVR